MYETLPLPVPETRRDHVPSVCIVKLKLAEAGLPPLDKSPTFHVDAPETPMEPEVMARTLHVRLLESQIVPAGHAAVRVPDEAVAVPQELEAVEVQLVFPGAAAVRVPDPPDDGESV